LIRSYPTEQLEAKIDKLRGLFTKGLDNVVGLDSNANVKPFNSGLIEAKLHAYVLEDYPYFSYLDKSKISEE
jgi:hypothetical protein